MYCLDLYEARILYLVRVVSIDSTLRHTYSCMAQKEISKRETSRDKLQLYKINHVDIIVVHVEPYSCERV